MTKTEVIKTIDSGKIFSCRFVKQNGEVRYLRGRTGVRKYTDKDGNVHEVKGDATFTYLQKLGMKFKPEELGYRVVFDLGLREYRMINCITIIEFNKQSIGNFFIQETK
jgi:hypothetical protein